MPRVLVIEDDAHQRDIYTSLLYYNGFDIEQAHSAEGGMAIARANPPDVILIDVHLPALDGLTATRLLKDDPATANVPIVCISAYDVPAHMVRQAGADDFLRKPLSGDVMVRAIRRLIGWEDKAATYGATRNAVVIAPRDSSLAARFATLLRLQGFKVSRAADGATGLGVAVEVQPRIILLHLETPLLDGWTVLQRLRTTPRTARTPVIAISDIANADERQRAQQHGFASYLTEADPATLSTELYRLTLDDTHRAH